jgi:hypothetical protein
MVGGMREVERVVDTEGVMEEGLEEGLGEVMVVEEEVMDMDMLK